MQRSALSPGMARKLMEMTSRLASDVLPTIRVPTLVCTRRGDRVVPVEYGREVDIELIPGARFIEYDGEDAYGWATRRACPNIEEFMIVSMGLLCLTWRAANAAKSAAMTATLTLKSGRPYVLVEKGELTGFDAAPKEITEACIVFKNFGNRPALINRIVLRLDHVEAGKYPAKRDFSNCAEKSPAAYALGAGETLMVTTDPIHGWQAALNVDDIREGKRALICYGCLYYSDVVGAESQEADWKETGFLWYYAPHPPEYLLLAELMGQPRKYKGRFIPARAFGYHT